MKVSRLDLLRMLTLVALTTTACDDDPTNPEDGGSGPAAILHVDLTDFEDGSPSSNMAVFTGVPGVLPDVTVTDNGNFPELDLRDFFTSDRSGSGETSATAEGLADFEGRTYGQLFLSGHFEGPSMTDIPPTSLGLLATNRQHHDFDVNETALRGQSMFDLTALGFTSADFGNGGDVYAQDFPFVKIGRWELAPPPEVLLYVDYSDFLDTDPSTNSVKFTGVDGAMPRVNLVDPGNFPELELKGFFTSEQSGSGETSASAEGLADFMGRTYGQLFLSGHFDSFPIADISPHSLGLLATNRQHHDFDINRTALTGESVFDLSGMGLVAGDFATGGALYAQNFPFLRIGRWEASVD